MNKIRIRVINTWNCQERKINIDHFEKETKERAKRYARRHGTSVSKMGESFLASISGVKEDPVHGLGEHPVNIGVSSASEEHDYYIYTPNK